MDKDEVKIQIKTVLDSLGADQAKAVLKELQAEAEGAGSKGKAGLDRFRDSTRGVTTAMRALRTAMAGFGIAGFIKMLGDGIRKMDEVVSAKRRMTEEIQRKNDTNAAEGLLKVYEQIRETLRQTAEEVENTNSLEDKRLENLRKLQDAQMRLGEEREVEALAADDPDRERKEKAIRARYAAKRDRLSGDRAGEDVERDAKRKEEAAAADQRAIDELNENIRELTAAWRDQSGKGMNAQTQAGSAWNYVMGRSKGYQAAADRHNENAGKLFGQIMAAGKDIQERERSRDRNLEGAKVSREGQDAVRTDAQASGIVSARNVRAADEGVAKAERDRAAAKEAAAEKERIKKRTAEQQEHVHRSRLTEEEARLNLEDFDKRNARTTNTRQRDAARAPLEQAHKDSASARQAAERELAQYMAANKEYLQGVTALARDGKREIEKLKSRQAAGSCDAAGD